jgi:hypothetical protein
MSLRAKRSNPVFSSKKPRLLRRYAPRNDAFIMQSYILLDFQVLAAMGAGFGVTRIGLAAIETGGPIGWSRRPSRDKGGFPSLIPVEKVEGEEDDQEEEDADGPEKALPEGVPVLLGVKENPHGDNQRNYIKEDEKETHGISQKQRSAGTGFEFHVSG